MNVLTFCPRQKLMHVLAVISLETLYHTSRKTGTILILERTTALRKWILEKGYMSSASNMF